VEGPVFNKRCQVYETDNTLMPDPDLTRILGLARRLQGGGEITTSTYASACSLERLYLEQYKSHGVCAGTVCNWAYEYLSLGTPELRPSGVEAAETQGAMQMTLFKRLTSAKDGGDLERNIDVARRKMYAKKGMVLSSILDREQLADAVHGFKHATRLIADWVELIPEVPCLLSVPMKGGGRHALGALQHPPKFYALDPNHGLYAFTSRTQFENELTNYFVTRLEPLGTWSLLAIGGSR
jgi:hypothetical protein